MQKVGEVCKGCEDRWRRRDQSPRVLKGLPRSTTNKGVIVPVCTYCDGPVLEFAQKNAD